MNANVVFDIGGTFIRGGIYDESIGLYPKTVKERSPDYRKISKMELVDKLLLQMKSIYLNLIEEYEEIDVKGIGVSFPGPINEEGIVISAPTLWGNKIEKINFKKSLEDMFPDQKCVVINDISAAGYRYLNKEQDTFGIITISSGVGCKIFYDGNLLLDKEGIGGELGHVFYRGLYEEFKCDCGGTGHIGSIASGRGIEQLASYIVGEEIKKEYKNSILCDKELTTYTIVEAIKQQDKLAIFILHEAVKPIADTINLLTLSIGLKSYIIIGGFACSISAEYLEALIYELNKINFLGLDKDEIKKIVKIGDSDDNNGLIGIGKYLVMNDSI